MAKKKKQFKDYQDYLASPEWKALKDEFYDTYEGFNNVCEISGKTIYKEDDDYMCLHHWRYASDWNNDSIDNVILVCGSVHDWIHDNGILVNKEISNEIDTRTKCKCEIISHYIDSDSTGHGAEGYEHGRMTVLNDAKEANKTVTEINKNLTKEIVRLTNHIDLLMEKANG